MKVTNRDILVTAQSGGLQALMDGPMRGKYSLTLKRVAKQFDEELKNIQMTRQEIAQKAPTTDDFEALSDEEKAEHKAKLEPVQQEMDEMLDSEVEISALDEKMPEEVVHEAKISGYQLETLDWLIDFE